MPTYLVKKRFWDDEKNLDQETSVKVTNDRNEAVTAFKEILICAGRLINQDADTKDKMKIQFIASIIRECISHPNSIARIT
ncbi:hypothetical protein [Paenibacillus xylanilyticus]|uniref:Uncharacterized protein n=1 Tax=Paenibacillus xylanilyticus TaxID=248903 RepID=A0A7Y6BTQ0_9BACL|nr:hypothetical protein [Paenibacillus xylanilyticus]NUU74616.1 hypothetical protein [Paenibacillus xylanilyticus]